MPFKSESEKGEFDDEAEWNYVDAAINNAASDDAAEPSDVDSAINNAASDGEAEPSDVDSAINNAASDDEAEPSDVDVAMSDAASNDEESNNEGLHQNHGRANAVRDFLTLQRNPDGAQLDSLLQKVREHESKVKSLLQQRNCLNSKLAQARKRKRVVELEMDGVHKRARSERETLGISDELWHAYETFCDSLKPGECVAKDLLPSGMLPDDTYRYHDPDFSVLKSSVILKLEDRRNKSWRCHRLLAYSQGGWSIGYYVDYYAQNFSLVGTWEENFPKLYELAEEAAKAGSVAAFDMLLALPEKGHSIRNHPCLFEFGFTESRRYDPVYMKRWGFRAAHDILNPMNTRERRTLALAISLGLL